jgi:hypothetical protein
VPFFPLLPHIYSCKLLFFSLKSKKLKLLQDPVEEWKRNFAIRNFTKNSTKLRETLSICGQDPGHAPNQIRERLKRARRYKDHEKIGQILRTTSGFCFKWDRKTPPKKHFTVTRVYAKLGKLCEVAFQIKSDNNKKLPGKLKFRKIVAKKFRLTSQK